MTYSFRTWGAKHDNRRIIIPETLAFHERWELFMPKRYPDGFWPDGSVRWSIGFGHTEGGDNDPKVITEDMELTLLQAKALLLADIIPKARWVDARIKVPLTTFMYGALVSLVYQFGQGRLDKAQTGLLKDGKGQAFPFIEQFNNGKYVDGFCTVLELNFKKDGTVSKGHKLRRAAEVGFAMTRID